MALVLVRGVRVWVRMRVRVRVRVGHMVVVMMVVVVLAEHAVGTGRALLRKTLLSRSGCSRRNGQWGQHRALVRVFGWWR